MSTTSSSPQGVRESADRPDASAATAPASRSNNHPPGAKPKSRWLASILLLVALACVGVALAAWKLNAMKQAGAAAANQPEPMETVSVAVAEQREHMGVTTAIGTVMALRSVSLRNELAGTVRDVMLTPGQVVEEGTLLVALDVAVEEAELKAQEAEAALAETLLNRLERALQNRATSQAEVDRARAQLDVARAQSARIKAIIARKTIRAPFRARVGISDVHPGQYLNEGTLLTTLQGVDEAVHVDFAIPQHVAEHLRQGVMVEIVTSAGSPVIPAEIVALDSRVDSTTRNTTVRVRVADADKVPPPGASVRVRVPAGERLTAVSVPISALRKSPAGDHLYVVTDDEAGVSRAHMRFVRSGPALGDTVLVLSGVTVGERVATEGSFKLRDKVRVVVAGTNKPAALN